MEDDKPQDVPRETIESPHDNIAPAENDIPQKKKHLTAETPVEELLLAYRKASADAEKSAKDYQRLIAENFDLREENSRLRDELRKLNCLRIGIEANPEVSRETKILAGKSQGLNLFSQMPSATYEEVESIIFGWEGMLTAAIEVLKTKDKTIKIRRADGKKILQAVDERAKKLTAKPAKDPAPRKQLSPVEKLARQLTHLPEEKRLAVAQQMWDANLKAQ